MARWVVAHLKIKPRRKNTGERCAIAVIRFLRVNRVNAKNCCFADISHAVFQRTPLISAHRACARGASAALLRRLRGSFAAAGRATARGDRYQARVAITDIRRSGRRPACCLEWRLNSKKIFAGVVRGIPSADSMRRRGTIGTRIAWFAPLSRRRVLRSFCRGALLNNVSRAWRALERARTLSAACWQRMNGMPSRARSAPLRGCV